MWTRASHKKKECWHYNSSNYGVRICAEYQGKKYSSPHFALIVASLLFFGVVNCSNNNLNNYTMHNQTTCEDAHTQLFSMNRRMRPSVTVLT